jgi:hypothetical protein
MNSRIERIQEIESSLNEVEQILGEEYGDETSIFVSLVRKSPYASTVSLSTRHNALNILNELKTGLIEERSTEITAAGTELSELEAYLKAEA